MTRKSRCLNCYQYFGTARTAGPKCQQQGSLRLGELMIVGVEFHLMRVLQGCWVVVSTSRTTEAPARGLERDWWLALVGVLLRARGSLDETGCHFATGCRLANPRDRRPLGGLGLYAAIPQSPVATTVFVASTATLRQIASATGPRYAVVSPVPTGRSRPSQALRAQSVQWVAHQVGRQG